MTKNDEDKANTKEKKEVDKDKFAELVSVELRQIFFQKVYVRTIMGV